MFLPFEALHPEQNEALEVLEKNSIIFLTGCAGTAKTFVSMHHAISLVLDPDNAVKKLYLCRTIVPMGRDMGFLPGSPKDKIAPYLHAVTAAYKKQLAHDPKLLQKIERSVEFLPTQFIRGMTMNDVLVVDEAQNCTGEEILAICTRIGKGGKIIFCGDVAQSDLRYSPLREAAECLSGIRVKKESVAWFEFSDNACVRSGLTKAILKRAEGAAWLN